jgi:hypothetical protein
MSERELEAALKRALRPVDPGEDFVGNVLQCIERSSTARQPGGAVNAPTRSLLRWLPISLAACALCAFGVLHWQRASIARERGLQARGQLFEALSITSAQVNTVRAAVVRDEKSLN